MNEGRAGETAAHTVITREELAGVEFDWFAADTRGHVAQFMAAGDTGVPQAALASEELLEALHVWIDTRPEREEANAPAQASGPYQLARDKLERARDAMEDGENLEARRLAEQALVDAQLAEAQARSEVARTNAEELRTSIETLQEEITRRSPRTS